MHRQSLWWGFRGGIVNSGEGEPRKNSRGDSSATRPPWNEAPSYLQLWSWGQPRIPLIWKQSKSTNKTEKVCWSTTAQEQKATTQVSCYHVFLNLWFIQDPTWKKILLRGAHEDILIEGSWMTYSGGVGSQEPKLMWRASKSSISGDPWLPYALRGKRRKWHYMGNNPVSCNHGGEASRLEV